MVQLIQDFDKEVKIVKASESAVTVYFGVEIRIDLHQKVKALMTYLENKQFPWLVEVIPAFSSVTILYNPFQTPGTCSPSDYVCQKLKDCIMALKKEDNQKVRTVTIPVCYGGSFGPDLSIVAKHNQLSPEEVIDIHSSGEYLVYMVGFAPGFPYLGGMSNRIATPRKEQLEWKYQKDQ
ncbi:allophanate hydrolase 2 subunit 1 [Halalkalibacter wakoensis JCM 9140]|uniref:Allophanate hydrolase 2 subunit 1 n=1 Tax=Halalkalibacter wakoensis JCM 9140 TaxID=1236970 RepID=W4Q3Z6_9BACI|nr:allophanate hydrolase 2 subunit 1 [Halalkalibacter wakoensis JCM 9140]